MMIEGYSRRFRLFSMNEMARVESLPLAAKRLGDFVRGRNSIPFGGSAFEPCEGERQVEGLFESLLAEAFNG